MLVLIILLCVSFINTQNQSTLLSFDDKAIICEKDTFLINNLVSRNNPNCVVMFTGESNDGSSIDDSIMKNIISFMPYNFSWIIKKWKYSVPLVKKRRHYSISGYEHEAGIFIARNLSFAEMLIMSGKNSWTRNPHAQFVTILYEECRELSEIFPRADDLFREIWNRTGIIHMLMVISCADEKNICLTSNIQAVYEFDPFYFDNNSGKLGHILEIDYTKHFGNKKSFNDLNGYPVKVSQFESSMSILKKKRSPAEPDELWGMDVTFAANVAKVMNFTPVYIKPFGSDWYGYRMDNGTYTGTLDDLLEGRSDMSLVASFIKDYETQDLEFSISFLQDRACFVVSKAKRLPMWMILFTCFSLEVWFCILLVFPVTSIAYLALVKTIRMSDTGVRVPNRSWYEQVIDIIGILLSQPLPIMPLITAERVFVSACMIWSLNVISGAFQGSLYNAYTTPSFYREIDTLEDLDNSGYYISLNSFGIIKDILGDAPVGTVPGNLRSKIRRINQSIDAVRRMVLTEGNVANVEREFNYVAALKGLDDDLNCPFHLVAECPKTYGLAYMFPKGSALLGSVNSIIQRLLQGGIMDKWYRDTVRRLQKETARRKNVENEEPILTLGHLQLAFLILFFGLLSSTVVFLFEIRGGYANKVNLLSPE